MLISTMIMMGLQIVESYGNLGIDTSNLSSGIINKIIIPTPLTGI
jgi:hypothetical protein